MNPEQIRIEHIKENIPPILYNKLKNGQIENLQEVILLNIEDFRSERGVGKKVISELVAFQEYATNNLEELMRIYKLSTQTYELPIDIDINKDSDFLVLFAETISDYLGLLKNTRNASIITHYYGLFDEEKLSLTDIATYFDNTRERIRQIKYEILKYLQGLLHGSVNKKLRCKVKKEVTKKFSLIKHFLSEKQLYNKTEFQSILKSRFDCYSTNSSGHFVDLLIDLLGFYQCKKAESSFTKATLILTSVSNKSILLKSAEAVLRYLRKEIRPLNEMQIIIGVKKAFKSLKNEDILCVLHVLPEIEIYQTQTDSLFQVKFEFLSRASDRAFRVLLEKGNEMYIDDITSEINHRLTTTGVAKIYDRHSLALAADNRFVALAKSGYWTLKGWNKDTSKIEELVKSTLIRLNRPSTADEIYNLIREIRPTIKEKSVKAIIGRDCIKVEGKKWILSEWKLKYSHLAFSTRIRRINVKEPEHKIEQRARVMDYLTNKAGNRSLASQIIKDLKGLDKRYTRVSFYKLFEQEEYFLKVKNRKKIEVILKDSLNNSKLVVDAYNWNEVRKKLIRDLSNLFSGTECPTYTFSLEDAISLFYSFIDFDLQIDEFKGLKDRIIGNLNKYYFQSSDRTDKLNFLKQFLTCLDPLLKKILYVVSQQDYQYIITNKKGLGEVFNKLGRLDPTNERFKQANVARTERFGKQIQSSYYYRNNDTHSANDWTELELIQIITNCLGVYIYSCSEYFNELKNRINAA